MFLGSFAKIVLATLAAQETLIMRDSLKALEDGMIVLLHVGTGHLLGVGGGGEGGGLVHFHLALFSPQHKSNVAPLRSVHMKWPTLSHGNI